MATSKFWNFSAKYIRLPGSVIMLRNRPVRSFAFSGPSPVYCTQLFTISARYSGAMMYFLPNRPWNRERSWAAVESHFNALGEWLDARNHRSGLVNHIAWLLIVFHTWPSPGTSIRNKKMRRSMSRQHGAYMKSSFQFFAAIHRLLRENNSGTFNDYVNRFTVLSKFRFCFCRRKSNS